MNKEITFWNWHKLDTIEEVLQDLGLEYIVHFNNAEDNNDDSGWVEITKWNDQ